MLLEYSCPMRWNTRSAPVRSTRTAMPVHHKLPFIPTAYPESIIDSRFALQLDWPQIEGSSREIEMNCPRTGARIGPRFALTLAALLLAAPVASTPSHAEDYPARPI